MAEGHLETANLRFSYGESPVLRGLDLDFQPGLLHGIVGPNGCGKSTLLGLLSGLLPPSHGRAVLDAIPVEAYPASRLARKLALVEQEPVAGFPFTVYETALMGRHPHIPRFSRPRAADLEATEKALTAMDLGHLRHRSMADLSGGERQRTMVARGLAQDTPVLLLDEPTASMDIRHALSAMAQLRLLARDGDRTVIAVLHDLNLAARFCDRVVMLADGTAHATGEVRTTLTPANIEAIFRVPATVLDTREGPAIIFSQE